MLSFFVFYVHQFGKIVQALSLQTILIRLLIVAEYEALSVSELVAVSHCLGSEQVPDMFSVPSNQVIQLNIFMASFDHDLLIE